MANNTAGQGRNFKVSLGESDSNNLKRIAQDLNMNESEVMRKGLQLMALYAQIKDKNNSALILKEGDTSRELMILP